MLNKLFNEHIMEAAKENKLPVTFITREHTVCMGTDKDIQKSLIYLGRAMRKTNREIDFMVILDEFLQYMEYERKRLGCTRNQIIKALIRSLEKGLEDE